MSGAAQRIVFSFPHATQKILKKYTPPVDSARSRST
jgi:hypothetical protein